MRAADAVATDADRSDTGVDVDAGDGGGIDVGQRRVHVVGASGHDVDAIDLRAQAIVGEAADHRQARDAACSIGIHAGDALQQARGVAGAGALARDLRRVEGYHTEARREDATGSDDQFFELRACLGRHARGDVEGQRDGQRDWTVFSGFHFSGLQNRLV